MFNDVPELLHALMECIDDGVFSIGISNLSNGKDIKNKAERET